MFCILVRARSCTIRYGAEYQKRHPVTFAALRFFIHHASPQAREKEPVDKQGARQYICYNCA